MFDNRFIETITDASGSFSLSGITYSSIFTIRAEAEGYLPVESGLVLKKDAKMESAKFAVTGEAGEFSFGVV